MRMLLNALEIAQFFNTDENKEYDREFKVGEQIEVRKPQRWLIRDGAKYQAQGVTNKYSTVAMDQQFGIDWQFSSAEAVLNLDERDGSRFVKENSTMFQTAMAQIANEIDKRAAEFATYNVNNVVGTLGTAVTTFTPYHRMNQRLWEKSCPPGERGVIITPSMQTDIAANNLTLFNPSSEITRMFKMGNLGKAAGGEWYQSNNLFPFTTGIRAGAVTVNGSSQAGTSLTITATAGDTFLRGERFSISAVNGVNPMNRMSVGTLQNFVITQNLTALGGGVDVLQISAGNDGGIIGPGDQYQNVDALPITGATITMWPGSTLTPGSATSGRLGFMLHRDAFLMVGGRLPLPKAVEISSEQRDPKTGITLRFTRAWDSEYDQMRNRWDVLLGFGNGHVDNCSCVIAAN